ncbi:hypothetical protein ACFWNN_26760 [Lentzea sp. NPDC058450]|uniref:hypothetical protein n=1 Tax=Lentzea sp. NPDC058450 TaxID=3346505 RepID=UPI00365783F2
MITAARYVRTRFPPQTHGLAAVLTYVTVAVLCGSVPELAGGVTFVLLFLFLRLVDDHDDGEVTGRAGLLVVACLVLLFNLNDLRALAFAGGACAAALAAPLLPRRGVTHPVALFLGYEVAPLLVFGHGAVTAGAPPMVAAGAAVLLWSAYEYWKFSRKLDVPGYVPFGLGLGGRLVAAVVLAGVAVLASAALAVVGAVSWVLPVVVAVIAVAWALSMRSWWRAGRRGAEWWSGLTFVLAVDLAVLVGPAWGVWG